MALVAVPYEIPMTMRFRRTDVRRGVLLRGPAGWGEFSPFPEYGVDVAARWLRCAYEAATEEWPAPVRERIPVNVTVPAVTPEKAHEIVSVSSCTTAKVKVAEGDDVARVEAVRDALGPQGKLRVDANAAWDVDTAARSIKELDRFELEYVEQPVPSLEEMAALRKMIDVPLAADESVRTAEDPMRVAGLEAADLVVIKVQPLSGVRRSLEVADAAGLPAVVSSALETSVGMAAGVSLAAALPDLPYACGLGTVSLLQRDVVSDPLLQVGGELEVRRPQVDESLLEACRPSREVAEEWMQRLHAAAEEAGIEL